jgi:hypothetical protein
VERDRASPADALQPHPTITVVEESVRRYGPAVYGRLGINPARDLRYEMHVLFMHFLDERSKGRLPGFGHEHRDQLEAEFLEELRRDIAGLAKQVMEPEPPPTSQERRPGGARRAQRPRLWR